MITKQRGQKMENNLESANAKIAKFDLTKFYKAGEQFDSLNLEELKAKFKDNLETIEWLGAGMTQNLVDDNCQILKRIKQRMINNGTITGRDNLYMIENEIVYQFAKE